MSLLLTQIIHKMVIKNNFYYLLVLTKKEDCHKIENQSSKIDKYSCKSF